MGKFHEHDLPGEDLVLKGLEDLARGVESLESLLVDIGAPRLRRLGLVVPKPLYTEFPESRLYRLLERQDQDNAHARMNAYVRRLVSFESTLETIKAQNKAKNI